MTTPTAGTNRRSRVVALAAIVALLLSLLPLASVSAAIPSVVSVNRDSATPTTASTISWTVTFSESVIGVDASDFSLATGGSATGSAPTVSAGPGAAYTVTVASVAGDGTLCVNVLDDASILSVSTSQALASAFTCTQTYSVDNTDPSTVSINRVGATPTAAASVSWTVTFSEAVTGVDASDFGLASSGVSGASISSVSGSGSSYTVAASTGSGSGTLGLNLADNDSIVDGVGQPLGGSGAGNGDFTGQVYTINKAGPTVTINSAIGQPDPDNTSPVDFTAVFSSAVTGFTAGDVILSGTSGATTVGVSGGPTTYTVAVTGMTDPGTGTVIVTIPADVTVDGSSNPNVASTSLDNQVVWDSIKPTVTVNLASGQQDPTGVAPIVFSVVFSENVTGFTSADIGFTGSTVGGSLSAAIGGSGTTYTVSVTGMAAGTGNVVIVVATGAATDAAGNTSAAPTNTDNTVAWDTTPGPTVTINRASGQADPTGTSPINFTVVFSAAVTGFTGSDVVISGTTSGTKIVTLSGAGPTYTAAVSGMTSSGTVIATIPAGVALGAVGSHPTQASTSTINSVTFRLASKYIVTVSNATPNPGAAVTITAQLADAANVAVPTSGVVVTWSKTGTGGSFSSATSTTNATGVATVTFTVGTTTGTVHTVTATSPGGITGTSPNITVTLPTATLTLTSDLSTTTWRQFISLSAQFSGTAGGNRVVTFQRMTALLPATWVTIGTATSDSSGRATFNYGPPYNTQFRAVFAGATDLAAVTSNTITVHVRYKVSIKPGAGTTTFLRAGTRITYTATSRPTAPAGLQRVTFLIYKRVNGIWTFRTSATVPTVSGVASFTWRWSRGEWYIRARGNATVYNTTAYSLLSKVSAR